MWGGESGRGGAGGGGGDRRQALAASTHAPHVLYDMVIGLLVEESLQRTEAADREQLHVAGVAVAALLAVLARVNQCAPVRAVTHHEVNQRTTMRLDVAARVSEGRSTCGLGEEQRCILYGQGPSPSAGMQEQFAGARALLTAGTLALHSL